ncbi:MAG: beta-hexosaminidase [Oscillospiraceae bacterium]|nr:beta-hexosaminidase [Oscillospiraceae bacterium]
MKKQLLAVLMALSLTACGESVNEFMDIDANIGVNAPALGSVTSVTNVETTAPPVEETTVTTTEKTREQLLEERVDEIARGMKIDEKIGQLLLGRASADPAADMATYHMGGITFYADDFKNSDPDKFKKLIGSITRNAAVVPFYAVDEEGGNIVRVSKFKQFRDEPFPSPKELYDRGGTELLEVDMKEKADLLLGIGLNMDLAPVADVSADKNSYIYDRTIGQDCENTADAVAHIVHAANGKGLATCLKHFPGYGENVDTHKGVAHDPTEAQEIWYNDLTVFTAGIAADEERIPAVMVAHTIYDDIDPDHPASLSPEIHKALRERAGFDGVAITDDLGMDAIKDYASSGSVYVEAVLADNDLLCVTDINTAYNDLVNAYNDGVINDEIIDAHLRRILIMKLRFGIIK